MKHNASLFLCAVAVVAAAGCTRAQPVRAVKATPTAVETTVTTINSGTVYADEQAILNFGSMGRIDQVFVEVGAKVKKGQKIASLENADLRAGRQAAQAELKRARDLFGEKLVSQAALDEAKRAAESAEAAVDRSVIEAPFDGLITEVNLRKGEIAQVPSLPERPPVRIIDLKERLVKGEIDELDLGKVKQGMAARIRIPALGNKRFDAKVTSVVPFVSSTREQDRTSKIELQLKENDPAIPVGASAEVEILVDTKPTALTVPARAVLGTSKDRYLFKIVDGKLVRTQVTVGVGNYDRREIVSGLQAGDVVAMPADDYEMKDGVRVQVELQPWP
jgi:HlyD family secretion protein